MVIVKRLVKVTWGKEGKSLEKASLADDVANNIKNKSSIFVSPTFNLVDMMNAAADLRAKYPNRFNGAVGKLDFENSEHKVVLFLYTAADYVNQVANASGDPAKVIAEAGFTATSDTHTPSHVPEQSSFKKVEAKSGGIIDLWANKVDGYEHFIYIIAWGSNLPTIKVVNHQLEISGSVNFKILTAGNIHDQMQGFEPGTELTCWCAAQNAAGIGPLSSPVGKIFAQP